MKKSIVFVMVCAMVCVMVGCNNPHRSPKAIDQAYIESIYSGRFDDSKKYVTPESYPIVDFFARAFPPSAFEGRDKVDCEKIEVEKTSDSTAVCKGKVRLCTGRLVDESHNVVKRDGKWYVSLRDANAYSNQNKK